MISSTVITFLLIDLIKFDVLTYSGSSYIQLKNQQISPVRTDIEIKFREEIKTIKIINFFYRFFVTWCCIERKRTENKILPKKFVPEYMSCWFC
jgi:hypothetical protein